MLKNYLITHSRVHRWPAHRADVRVPSEVERVLQMKQGEIPAGGEEAKEHVTGMLQFPGKSTLLKAAPTLAM